MDETEQAMSYKVEHEKFVSDNTGSSVLEVAVVCASCPASVFLRDAVLSWLFGKKNISNRTKFIVDFITIILPGLLCTTLFSDHADGFLTSLLCSGFLLFVVCEKAQTATGARSDADPTGLLDLEIASHRPFITHFRAFTNVATAVFILAVDFSVYPRRFCKTETYGTGLMDVGVGGFIMANGIVSPEARGKFRTKSGVLRKLQQVWAVVKSTMPLVVLGLARLLAVKGTDYHEHVSEYGVHWNFFFTLAGVKVLSTVVLQVFPAKLSGLLAVAMAVAYQYTLETTGLKAFVLLGSDGQGSRLGILDANREGVFSCLGYLAIYLASVSLGAFLAKQRQRFCEWLQAFVVLMLVDVACWMLLYYVELEVDPVSRRMGNLAFVIWMLAHQLLFLLGFFLVDLIIVTLRYMGFHSRAERSTELCILEAVNRNGLVYFMLANLLTGLVNFSVRTIHASPFTAYTILTSYMLLLSLVTVKLHLSNVTLKFW